MMSPDEIRDEVRTVIGELAPNQEAEFDDASKLRDHLEYHSLAILELAVEIEAIFDLPPMDQQAAELGIETVAQVCDLVVQLVAEQAASPT